MREILESLGDRFGVRGSLLLTRDGVVVASALQKDMDAESVAALASAIISEAARATARLALGPTRRMILTAGFGRLLFEPFEELVLVVAIEPGLDIEHTLLEIAGPARRIREQSRLDASP